MKSAPTSSVTGLHNSPIVTPHAHIPSRHARDSGQAQRSDQDDRARKNHATDSMPPRKAHFAAPTTDPTQPRAQPASAAKNAENKPPRLHIFPDAPADLKPQSAIRTPSPLPADAQTSPHKRPSHKYG